MISTLNTNLSFPESERKRRWKGIRKKMSQRELDCLLIWGDSGFFNSHMANIRYVTQVGGNGEEAFCIFPSRDEPELYVAFGGGEWDDLTWVKDYHEVARQPDVYHRYIVQALRSLPKKKTVGIVGYDGSLSRALMTPPPEQFPYVILSRLVKEFPDVKFEGADDVLLSMRQPKSEEEILMMTRAAKIADEGSDAIYRDARAGIRESSVYANAMQSLLSNGSENSIQFWWSLNIPSLRRVSVTEGRRLKNGDFIICEFTPIFGGYRQHAHRTIHIGRASRKFTELYSAVKHAHDSCIKHLRPGITTRVLYEIGIKIIEEAGYRWPIPLFHGMGLGWEQPYGCKPAVMSVPDEAQRKIEAGYTVAFQYGGVTKDKKLGCIMGDVVVVTQSGCKRLSRNSLELDAICA